MESLLGKIDTCHNNLEKSSGYSVFTHCLLDNTKNKRDYYGGKDCVKKILWGFKKTCYKNNKI